MMMSLVFIDEVTVCHVSCPQRCPIIHFHFSDEIVYNLVQKPHNSEYAANNGAHTCEKPRKGLWGDGKVGRWEGGKVGRWEGGTEGGGLC